jgi:nicotinate-nucleotide pyrophosphorylase (carboxylating)
VPSPASVAGRGTAARLRGVHDVHPPVTAVRDAVARALAEDLIPLGDVTAALLDPSLLATGQVAARVDGVLAGRLCADEAFRQVDEGLNVAWSGDDGDRLSPGEVVATVTGPLASMLTAERTALNFLGHLSGIATLTDRFVAAVRRTGGTLKVWDTRKTTPGLRALEKAAVRAGGGANHRGNLSEWVMLKDNHLALVPIASAVATARSRWPGRTVQVECTDAGMVRDAVAADADIVLLDNMTPDEVRAIVAEVRAEHPRRPLLEISGRVDLDTVAAYATTGADLVSVGALTHSAPVLDIGLDVVA